MEKRKLVILGATSNGDLFELIELCGRSGADFHYEPVAFLDDNAELHGRTIEGLPVSASLECAGDFNDAFFINAIGTPRTVTNRRAILTRARVAADRFATFIHPRAVVSPSARVGNGALVFAGAVIGADVRLGVCCDVMSNAVISHGCEIGDYAFLASGAMLGGAVRIGEASFLGLNCSVRERLTIGARCILGQGAVIVNDVPDETVMVGNPARKLHDTSRF